MIRRFLDGMIFGAGFAIAFIFIYFVAWFFVAPAFYDRAITSTNTEMSANEINSAPLLKESRRYLGSTAIRVGDFESKGTLSPGHGAIVGMATVNDEPAQGVKLRLALNGSVMSQWASTDSRGRYVVSVPYGQYRIDGFELDHEVANKVLTSKIIRPHIPHSSAEFEVSEAHEGRGLDFQFVDPVVITLDNHKYSTSDDIVLEWRSYPGATQYQVQLYEKSDPHRWSNDTVFSWSDRPEVLEPRIRLSDYDVSLKSGHFYVVNVYALDNELTVLSETAPVRSGYDFEVVE